MFRLVLRLAVLDVVLLVLDASHDRTASNKKILDLEVSIDDLIEFIADVVVFAVNSHGLAFH